MTSNDFTTSDRIITNVTATVDDSEFKNGFSKGWYLSHVQQAMQDISIKSKWAKIIKDYSIPQNCQLELPKNAFDLREVYLYKGELCRPTTSQVVHFKRTFNNMPEGNGYTARIKDDGSNPNDNFVPNQANEGVGGQGNYTGTKYYYNVVNGILMLSESSKSYPFIRVIMNSMGGSIGDEVIIPRMFERAIQDYLEERFYNAMKRRNPRTYRILWADADARLVSPYGAWETAIKNVKSMDQATRESMNEYASNMFHK